LDWQAVVDATGGPLKMLKRGLILRKLGLVIALLAAIPAIALPLLAAIAAISVPAALIAGIADIVIPVQADRDGGGRGH
jgi:predicted ABC-type sugar transport system permease subunit